MINISVAIFMQNITFDDKKLIHSAHSTGSRQASSGLMLSKAEALKIGIVVDQLLAGGVQLAAIEQVKELNKLGHKAKLLILMRKKYPTDFSYLVKDIPYQFLSDSYPFIFRKTIKFPIFSFLSTLHLISPILAPRILKVNEYDILISLGTTTCLTTQAIFRKHKIPYIALIHDPIEYILKKAYYNTFLKYFFSLLTSIGRYFERSFVKDALETVIISKVHYDYIKSNYGITPQILGFGTKTLDTVPKQRGENLLSFGRWQKEKNPDFLLRLAKSLPNVKLTIAGSWIESKELERFKQKVKKASLSEQITIIPYYEDVELAKLCAKSRLFIHPHFEAFGLAALEAAGHGLPIIIPEKSGVTEIFKHGIHGFFPKTIEVDTYKRYINTLLSNPQLAYKMGFEAWKKVAEEFSWEVNVKNLLAIINSALSLNEKPNILILETGHALGHPLAGGDKLMEPMATRLSDKYRFSVVVSSVGAKHWREARFNKETIILPKTRFDQSGKPIQVFLAYCIRMWQTYGILKKRIDIKSIFRQVIYSSTNILPDVLPAYLAKKRNKDAMWIARIHHLIPPPNKREGIFIVNAVSYVMQLVSLHMIRSKADLTLVLNVQLLKDLQKKGFLREKLKVLGGGIEFDQISNLIPKEKIKFQGVFLGRLHVTKGIFDTIPIWKNVIDKIPNAKFAIIGDGPSDVKIHLEEKIRESDLQANIKLLGFLPYEKVYTIMKQADLFLFLDHEAGWGLAVAEAMACGLPVVGYDIGVLGTIYKNGYLVAPISNYEKLSDQIIKLLENKNYRQDLSIKARLEAQKHDWEKTSKKFNQLLKDNILI